MSQTVVVTAVGQDQPGIVAALARALFDVGANLDDATMTRLHNAFATMVSATLPDTVPVDHCRAALAPVADELGLAITVQPVLSTPQDPDHGEPDHLITVYGTDKPGIVYRVAARLAELGVNITDMDTRRAGTDQAPLYVMVLEVASGGPVREALDLEGELAGLRGELGVDITVQSLDREAL